MLILGPKTAILGPQFCRILMLGPHFWSSGEAPLDPPYVFSSCAPAWPLSRQSVVTQQSRRLKACEACQVIPGLGSLHSSACDEPF